MEVQWILGIVKQKEEDEFLKAKVVLFSEKLRPFKGII